MEAYFTSLAHNTLMLIMAAGIALDTILGVLRALVKSIASTVPLN